ncbi:DUF6639 family protein [Salipiger mucosus]|uniref:Uncharacterized protein n=1 Tax=Salipiger mucosus DSM 16094 TaxID=1123237 RepID=S9SHE0_9RHOB|nr:DUF6639 family protein [Salipiger mucosus]EPX85709.1 hypothetical protein Salmuc_04981 [Salipiger mucosus DSM 16094]
MRAAWRSIPPALILAAGLAAAPVGAAPVTCEDPAFFVETAEPATREMICAAASGARQALARCGLEQREPIGIETVDSLIHAIGQCLAAYDCTLKRIRIIAPELLREHLPPDDPYAALPDEVVFGSLLTHELAHAIVVQQSGDREIALVDHEYIANALELSALPPEHRETLLDAAGVEPPVSADVIDLFIYGLAPRRFAAAAYLYLEANGCGTVTDILEGTATFRVAR